MFRKKGQAALEFLTTYGWAFLVILVMIGALSYFGVLNPSNLLPDKCLFGVPLGACTDVVANPTLLGTVKFKLINGGAETLKVTGVTTTATGTTGQMGLTLITEGFFPYSWDPGTSAEFVVHILNLADTDKPKLDVVITYTGPGGYEKTIEGQIIVKA